ncbi:MAG: DEAD/DEAH box helicase, partial [Acidobacteriota bacterium]|nr:DEAD/DEAH box helicase [Acidobacteriota bacterium]
ALGDHSFDTDTLRDLFRESGRYHKLAGKLFDAAGYDGVYLRPLYDTDRDDGRLHVSDLFRMMAFFKGRLTVSTNELTEKVYADLKSFEGAPPPELTETNLNLRDYQKIGYEWLYFLRSFGLGGLLCDQMGLGKTHQGMALLSAVLAEKAEARVLVIAPTSVIYHWKDKLQTFCPKVGASIYHGADRRPQSTLQRFQVMISTYGTLRNDYDYFQDHLFDLILFDEIQNLKNKDTKMYKGLSRLKARCKIGLTGTPIENHITELKSLMDLVFPGYLGSDAQFRKFFADPIVKYNSDHAKEQVRGMIKPFILRRKKSEVLLELPEKTEDMRTFKLGEYERELYKEVKEKGKKLLAEDPDNKMHIFGLITHLKMVCDHPALYFKNADYSAYPSAKWMLFKELLEEAMDSGEKVVVFTQYLGMVDIITHYLGSQGIGYASITGATRDRRREQSRFMEDEDCRVFVGSIKAAGVGIDLTSASIAIHYDRWWNPAVEEQATDRIHRIGQKKNVQVYKFVGVDTVEQRIDAIISRKRGLLEDVVGFDSDSVGKTLTMDELLEILS